MPWYEIGASREEPGRGKDLLIRMTQTIWEASGKPDGFALLGTHTTHDGKFDVCYLTPACQDPINGNGGGYFTFWQVIPTDKKPPRESLEVLVGDPKALALLD